MRKILFMAMLTLLAVSLVLAEGPNADPAKPDDAGNPEPTLLAVGQGQPDSVGAGSENASIAGEGQQVENQVALQNMGEESQIQAKERVRELVAENGAMLRVEASENERATLKAGNSMAKTGFELVQTENNIRAKLSNGKDAEIKVMPDAASEKALERLRIKVCSEENACQIELKETGRGDATKAAYEVQIERHSRILGIFQAKMQVKAQVDAANGEVIQVKKPWWAFLASEPEE
ncbi:hypothetical protein JW826_02360 [Candidatus Woesearchaeota archaeon]|nr:hypothetical protein [Candidatus Woesearchaeota archaeon]